MKELIKDINSVLKNGVLVMSIEVKPSVINSIHIEIGRASCRERV